MARPGPKPRSTALKVLHGETRRSRLPAPGPVPQLEEVKTPAYLDADARAVWDRLAPMLEARDVLTAWDVDAFAVFCAAVVHHRRAVALVDELGPLVSGGPKGPTFVKNPALQVVRDQAAIIARYCALFGLSASDRVGLSLGSKDDPRNDPDYPWDV